MRLSIGVYPSEERVTAMLPFIGIVVAVLVVIGLVVGGVYLVKAGKGKLSIALDKGGYNCGDTITGTLDLEIRKPLEPRRLFVSLIGYEEFRERDHDGDMKTRREEVYRFEENIPLKGALHAGTTESFKFQLPTPAAGSLQQQSGAGWLSGTSLEVAGFTVDLGNRRKMIWYVEGRLDLPGLDLAHSQKVALNG
ncbi:MAG: hypothetical protein AAF456_04605 [Planctomycetota bacterium]